MSRPWIAILVVAGVLAGCSPEAPPAALAPEPESAAAPVPPAAESPATPTPPPPRPARRASAPLVAPPVGAPAEAPRAQPIEEDTLGRLLRVPGVDPKPRDPLAPRAAPVGEAETGPGASWRDRVRVSGRSEKIGPAGPRQGTWSETDAGVSVPLDERLSVEGGLRMEKREEPGMPQAERKNTPRVGVELKF